MNADAMIQFSEALMWFGCWFVAGCLTILLGVKLAELALFVLQQFRALLQAVAPTRQGFQKPASSGYVRYNKRKLIRKGVIK